MGDLRSDSRLCQPVADADSSPWSHGGLWLGSSDLVAREMAAFHQGRLGFRAARWPAAALIASEPSCYVNGWSYGVATYTFEPQVPSVLVD